MFKRKSNYTLRTLDEKQKKFRKTTQALFIWALIIGNVVSWVAYAQLKVQSGDPLAGDSRPPLSGDIVYCTPECDGIHWMEYYDEEGNPTGIYYDDVFSTCATEFISDNHANAQLVQDDPTIVFLQVPNEEGTVFVTEADPELYWITHYGPPTFAPTDVTAWGMSIAESLEWAEQLSEEWGTPIKGICATHKYTPWYAKNIYPPVLLKVEGRGNYLVLDRKGINDSIGVDIYEPDQDGPMYNYKGEVTEIVGWWCE